MSLSRVQKVDITILSGQTNSNTLLAWQSYGTSAGIIIHSPSGLVESVRIQVSPDNGTTWFDLQDGSPAANVTVPAAGAAQYHERLVLATAIRFVAGAAVAANRVFNLSYQAIYE